jgi:hypothetical protein
MREIARILKPGGLASISVDINVKQRVVEPLMLIWESGLSIHGTIDLTMPAQRFGIFHNGKQPSDVFGFVLCKPDASIRTDYGNASPLIEAWKVCCLRDTFGASYQGFHDALEYIGRDLQRNNRSGRPTFITFLRVAAKILLRRYPGTR